MYLSIYPGSDLQAKIGGLVDKNPAMLKLISGGKVIQNTETLNEQVILISTLIPHFIFVQSWSY